MKEIIKGRYVYMTNEESDRRWAAFKGIQCFGMLILVLSSALCVFRYPLVALILAECAHIFYRGTWWYSIKKYYHDKINFIAIIAPGAIAVVIAAVSLAIVGNDQTTK